MHKIRPGKPIFGNFEYGVYEMLGQFEPGTIVDAGAAAGHMTSLALKYSPQSRAICFEPFPGNWPFIEKTLAGKNAAIIKAALAEKSGEARFFVGSTAKAEGQWANFPGYSSVGYIVAEGETRPENKMIIVPVTTVDEHVKDRVLIFKIDVQGGELNTLKGAETTFRHGVDIAYVEFNGEIEVLNFLHERGYVIFDHRYLITPLRADADLSFWEITKSFHLSTGQASHYGWPARTPQDPSDYCEMFKIENGKIGSVYTDIVAVREDIAKDHGWIK